jgi:hypothetical protein
MVQERTLMSLLEDMLKIFPVTDWGYYEGWQPQDLNSHSQTEIASHRAISAFWHPIDSK